MQNNHNNGNAKNKILKIGNKKLKTPMLFFGQPIGGTPNPWEKFDVDGILINAYHILQKKNVVGKIENKKTLTNYLSAKKKTFIMMDSGGFLFQKSEVLDFNCREIIKLYRATSPDLGVVLDHPFSPTLSEEENVRIRWKKTMMNTKIMLKEGSNLEIMPVIHGYTIKQIKKSWIDIKKIISKYETFTDKKMTIGIGSLVPLMMTSQGATNGKNKIVDLILTLREEIPDAHIHAFGIGGATTALIMYYLGVDSLDSVSWRLKAAKGAIQLPGVGDRFIKPPNGRPGLSNEEEKLLEKCNCPICKDRTLTERKFALGPEAPSNFENRAIHNAWLFQSEIEICRKEIKANNFANFIQDRLKKSMMRSMFRYATNKLSHKSIDSFK